MCKTDFHIEITPQQVTLNDNKLPVSVHGDRLLLELYKTYVGNYPKFYKMDLLCQLGFIGSELLLMNEKGVERFVKRDDRAVILANRSASITADNAYSETIRHQNYFPSPSLFVYTLPNIVAGEIAIRNRYCGETMFYVLQDQQQLSQLAELAFLQPNTTSALTGWIECISKDDFYLKMTILWKN